MVAIGTSFFLVCLLVQLTLVNSALLTHHQGCPSNLTHEPNVEVFGSKCYIFYASIHRSEFRADWICKRRGGSLAKPKTEEINSFLAKQMGDYDMDSAWIGLKRVDTSSFTRYFNRDFQWDDGSSVNYSNFHPFSSVPFYEDSAIYMDDDGYWLEESGSQSFSFSLFIPSISSRSSFICEVDRDPAFVAESDSDPKAEGPDEGVNDSEVDGESEVEEGDETKTDDDEQKPDKPSDTPADSEGDEKDPQKTDDGEEEEQEDKGLANPESDHQGLNDTEKNEPVPDSTDSSILNDTEKSEPLSDSSDSSILNDTEKIEPVSDSSDSSMDSDSDDGKEIADDEGGQKHHCQFDCHLDCGMMGYLKDSETGCAICECDED